MPRRATSTRWALAALAGGVATLLVDLQRALGPTASVLWWSSGLLAGLLIRLGWRSALPMWCGIFVLKGVLTANVVTGMVAATALLAGPTILAAYLQHHGFRADLPRRSDVLRFVLATLLAMVVTPSLMVLTADRFGSRPGMLDPLARWPEWWLQGTVSVLLLAPAVANASRAVLRQWAQAPWPMILSLAGLAALAAVSVIGVSPMLPAMASPFALIIAVYAMQRTDLVFGPLVTMLVTWTVIVDAANGPSRVYALVVAATALLVRVLFAERQRAVDAVRDEEIRLRDDILRAEAQERRRIGRDMHDTIGQELTSIALLARAIELRARREAPALADEAALVQQACRNATHSARAISHRLLVAAGDP